MENIIEMLDEFHRNDKERKRSAAEARNAKAREILEYNRKRLYRLPKKFPYLRECFSGVIEEFLLDIIAYWLKKDCLAYGRHPLVFFLGTNKGTYAIRRRHSRGTTNQHLNYLCALGLLKKLPQVILYTDPSDKAFGRRYLKKGLLTAVNRKMLRYKSFKVRPINTFELFKYTTDELQKCNERAKRLLDAKITRGNISYNQLAVNGLQDIADEIYLENRDLSVAKKDREYKLLDECITFLLNNNGYTTKAEIYLNCCVEDKELDKLFRIYKNDLWKNKEYKRPSKADKEKYGLVDDTWVIKYK